MTAVDDRQGPVSPGERAARLAAPPLGGGRSHRLALDQIMERLPLAVDRTMGEAGLWAPELAARALRQAQGDPLDAAHLLRAHRAALPRLARSLPVTSDELLVTRRISSAFRSPPGGQLLGRTLDYVGRLLDLLPEDEGRTWAAREAHSGMHHTVNGAAPVEEAAPRTHDEAADDSPYQRAEPGTHTPPGPGAHTHRGPEPHTHGGQEPHTHGGEEPHTHPGGGTHAHPHGASGTHEYGGVAAHREPADAAPYELAPQDDDGVERTPTGLLSVLRAMEVVAPVPPSGEHVPGPVSARGADPEPYDVTRAPAGTDAPRSAWLQAMARADTGSLMHTWYGSNWRPSGHEIPGEVRHGTLPLRVSHPETGRPVTITRILVSEVQTFHSLTRAGELSRMLDVGYGLCLGRNDRKAISMAGLDLLLRHHRGAESPMDEVLFTLDGLDSVGQAGQLKLPHHVGFRSVVERARAVADNRRPTGTARAREHPVTEHHVAAGRDGRSESS